MFRDAYDPRRGRDIPKRASCRMRDHETRTHRRFMVPAEGVNEHGRVSNWEIASFRPVWTCGGVPKITELKQQRLRR
jgi:hypothetical protein